ncbi:twinkle mtDNA helicase-like isoform X2 [Corticium candelabrum]|uniref:twinkle mtDNA helicase-like isoform X2 n=1 Tax=Corticium candelabrum TaxID=121492 RepID=UPI002E258657|nr:twinkle mtDNA helicase-like isoform X2 [Corticium candelabrum]
MLLQRLLLFAERSSQLFACGRRFHGINGLIERVWSQCVPLSQCDSQLLQTIRTAFNIKLSNEILDKFDVRYTQLVVGRGSGVQDCVAFPLYDFNKKTLLDISFGTIDVRKLYGSFGNSSDALAVSLFGWHTVASATTSKLVVTDSEFDALAVYQTTSLPVVSLPSSSFHLSDRVFEYLDRFDSVVLWSGKSGFAGSISHQLATRLSAEKCHFVRPLQDLTKVGPLEAMNKEMDMRQLVQQTQPLLYDKIVSFHQLREHLQYELLNKDHMVGTSWKRFPSLTEILKGHRRGELTVFTGPTGSGKTTFMSELSLDLCIQGVPTLWGSFEIRNVRLARTMINQLAGFSVEDQMNEYSRWAKRLELLPLYFMNFHGSQSLKSVIEAMTHAVHAYDIRHVVIDNLQFMISPELIRHDRFLYQDMVISAFRTFATSHNVHVTLVIHPRKEEDDRELSMSSIFGSAKASQEADNVLILHVMKGRGSSKRIQVIKNRFDGSLGSFFIQFDPKSLRMSRFSSQSDLSDDQGKNKQHGQKKIIDRRRISHNYQEADGQKDAGGKSSQAVAGHSLRAVTSGELAVSMTTLSKKIRKGHKGNT